MKVDDLIKELKNHKGKEIFTLVPNARFGELKDFYISPSEEMDTNKSQLLIRTKEEIK